MMCSGDRGTKRWLGGRGTLVLTLAIALGGVTSARASQPTLDELLELGSPEEQREALRDAAVDDDDTADEPEEIDLDETLRRMLESDDPADLFRQAVQEMTQVSERLGDARDVGIDTQRMQQSILDKLDQVIAAAQQQQSESSDDGGGSAGEASPQQADRGGDDPAQQQSDAPGAAQDGAEADASEGDQAHSGDASPGDVRDGQTPEEALRELRQEWGNLPPRLRDEISEGMHERFSPVYRSLTESYYRRLAEEE